MYVCIYTHIYTYIYIYIYTEQGNCRMTFEAPPETVI